MSSRASLNISKHRMSFSTSSLNIRNKINWEARIQPKLDKVTLLKLSFHNQQFNAKFANCVIKASKYDLSDGRETHLPISKHATVIASHAIFHHWNPRYFEQHLLKILLKVRTVT